MTAYQSAETRVGSLDYDLAALMAYRLVDNWAYSLVELTDNLLVAELVVCLDGWKVDWGMHLSLKSAVQK